MHAMKDRKYAREITHAARNQRCTRLVVEAQEILTERIDDAVDTRKRNGLLFVTATFEHEDRLRTACNESANEGALSHPRLPLDEDRTRGASHDVSQCIIEPRELVISTDERRTL